MNKQSLVHAFADDASYLRTFFILDPHQPNPWETFANFLNKFVKCSA